MKKLIGILGVAVIAATMFFSTNNVAGSGSDASLASLVGINSANAESGLGSYYPVWGDYSWGRIKVCLNGGSSGC